MRASLRAAWRRGGKVASALGLLLVVVGCQDGAGAGTPPPAESGAAGSAGSGAGAAAAASVVIDRELVERRLLRGGGDTCNDDRDCGPTGARGACLLGTCFGLLTTDSAAARSVLVERIAALPAPLAEDVERVCATLLWRPEAMPAQRIAAAQGLVAVASTRPQGVCGRACDELRKLLDEPDEGLASTARLGLACLGDASVLPALQRDLASGTEHSRCAAARALGGAWADHAPGFEVVGVALLAALGDSSPMVRRVAAEALVPHIADAEIAAGLQAARRLHPADLGYIVDRATAAAGAPGGP